MFLCLASRAACSECWAASGLQPAPALSGGLCSASCDPFLLGFAGVPDRLGLAVQLALLCWEGVVAAPPFVLALLLGPCPCPCASTGRFVPRGSLAATGTNLTLRPQSRHGAAGRQMSSGLMCSFQYK